MNYSLHYEKLIKKRRSERPEGYTESHHILPTCQDGPDVPENRVRLTPKEHLFAHLLLVKMNLRHSGLIYAANWMSNNGKYGCRKYAWLREKHSIAQSKLMKGKPKSEEHRKKIGEPQKGRIFSEESRKKMSKSSTGKIASEETRKKMSASGKGKPKSEEWKNKMRGRKHSEETLYKMRESWRRRHEL